MNAFIALYNLFLKHQLTKGRIVLIFVLSAIAVGLAFLISTQSNPGLEQFDNGAGFTLAFGTNLMVPLISLVLASATLGQLVEDETLVYLWLRPNSRIILAASAWLASATVIIPACAIPITLASGIASGDWTLGIYSLFAVCLGCFAYSAVFILLGLLTKKSVIWGLLYIFIWEIIITTAIGAGIGALSKLSIVYYVRSIIGEYIGKESPEFEEFVSTTSLPTSVIVLILISAIGVGLTSLRLSKMEVA